MTDRKNAAAIVLAAGESRRYAGESGVNKTLEPLLGQPVLLYSVRAFDRHPLVDRILVAARPGQIAAVREILDGADLSTPWQVLLGGADRRGSVLACLAACTEDYVIIQDGARPLLRERYITETLGALAEVPGASVAVPASDTVKLAGKDRMVLSTLPRAQTWLVQTPQAFRREVLLRAHAALDDPAAATDDCVALERIGEPVRLIPGDTDNRKLTFPEDRELLALALQSFSQEAASTP